MTVEQQVDALATSVDELKAAVVTKKATLDASVVDAQSATAQAQAAKANTLSARDQAGAFKDVAYTAAQSAASAVAYQDLTALAAEKAVTAVDVFIYDTSKDSDGGAWRHRCAGTSWYNEPLNTATRGARREFPAVAVIVAETGKVTIYDGDDPALPMWMVFTANVYNICPHNASVISLSAKNGIVAMAGNASSASYAYAGVRLVNFVTDSARKHTATNSHSGPYRGTIAQRNDSLFDSVGSEQKITHDIVNDVAMTVLPSAPIDQASGLPVPTIAVACGKYATAGGAACIINGPAGVGTVVDILVSQVAAGGYECVTVGFGPNGELLMNAAYNGSNTTINVFGTIPSTDLPENNIQPAARSYGFTVPALTPGTSSAVLSAGKEVFMADGRLASPQRSMYWSHLALIHENNSDKTKSMVAFIGHDFNTGWMVGDSRLAAICETDDADLTQNNIVTNGTFADLTGWSTTEWSASGGAAVVSSATAYASIYQNAVFKPNKAYHVSFDYDVTAGGLAVRAGTGGQFNFFTVNAPASGSFSGMIRTVFNTDGALMFTTMGGGITGSVSNVVVREVVADQGPKQKHLDVFGTVVRSPVAAGADLMACSGFSGANYLEQPYNSALDVGTGDLCIMGWINPASDNQAIISYENDTAGVGWTIDRSSGVLRLYTGRGGQNKAYSFGALNPGAWQFFCVYRSAGYWFGGVNGEMTPTGIIGANDIFVPDSVLRIGKQTLISGGAWTGSIAMIRASATAPSADQIRRIYEDEKALFQADAFCAAGVFYKETIKAVAHDPTSGLLHVGGVGAGGGRASFKGLRRVSKSTTPVATAIAACGDLVVAQ